MRILYISYDGLTDPLGQSQVLPYLTELSKLRHHITVLSTEKDSQYASGKDQIEAIVQKYNIKWVSIKYHSKPKLLSTLADISSLKNRSNTLHSLHNFDLVHCRSYIASLVGLWLKKKYGVKFIFDMRGFWADERIEGNIWSMNNPLHVIMYRYFKKKEGRFLKAADYTISLTEKAKAELQKRTEVNTQTIPIKVIPCCVDLDHFDPKSVSDKDLDRLRRELNINKEDFILSYLGSVGTWYMLDEMFEFFAELRNRKINAKFLFISPESREAICSKASKYDIPVNNILTVKANRKDVPTLISLSTISIFFIKPVYSKQASSPTKLGELLGMGIPVIANSGVGDMDIIFNNSSFGILVNEFTKNEYQRIIDRIDEVIREDKDVIRAVASENLSLEEGVRKYAQVYDKLNI